MCDNLYNHNKLSKALLACLTVFLCSAALCLTSAQAKNTEISRPQTVEAREKTILAIKAFRNREYDNARKLIAESRDPLAAKIYHWLIFTEQGSAWDPDLFITLTRFIRQNPDWPSVWRLRNLAETNMPEDLPSDAVLTWYEEYPPKTTKGMSRYMDALIDQGKKDQAREFLVDWWAGTLTSRDQQRDLFRKYGQYLTLDAHKRRFDALLLAGKYESAKAIADVLGQGYPALAEARIALAKRRRNVNALIKKVPSYLQDDAGLLFERLRWRRKHDLDVGAMEILHRAPDPAMVQNPEDWWQERHIIIRRLLDKKQYSSAYLLASKHMQTDGLPYAEAEWLAGWLALRFMDKPTEAYQHFTALYQKVSTPISRARAAYWSGRAAEGIGQKNLAEKWYKTAASFQTVYYGQMASIELRMTDHLPQVSPPVLTKSDLRSFGENELIRTALLFHKAGMADDAGRFLQAFISYEETPKAYRYGAELAAKMGEYHEAVRIAKKATKKGLFLTAQSYPTITKWLKNEDAIEWALIHALIRQESMFKYTAVSPAGARGLMQLMPSTARATAKKMNMSHQTSWLTQKPSHNIKLGAEYMRSLIERFDGNYPLAIASYNAGPGRVNQWLKRFGDPRKGEIDIIDWIELIPYSETRNYVQRVMEGVYVYRLRLKGIQSEPAYEIYVRNNR